MGLSNSNRQGGWRRYENAIHSRTPQPPADVVGLRWEIPGYARVQYGELYGDILHMQV